MPRAAQTVSGAGGPNNDSPELRRMLDALFRREQSRLVARVLRIVGPARLDFAEDVAQDALLAAARTWPYRGAPDNPEAWLHRVAKNKALDRLRRERVAADFARTPEIEPEPAESPEQAALEDQLTDDDLQLIFLCATDLLAPLDRVAVTLNVAMGFTAREIGRLYLTSEAAMAQRLARAKRRLRKSEFRLDAFAPIERRRRRQDALKAVYLAFALGFAPASGAESVRRDAAEDALRLARLLADTPETAGPDAEALAALCCFQASRFEARMTAEGAFTPLPEQDRCLWLKPLIDEGFARLAAAQSAECVTRYHLEAGIAACHAAAADFESSDWAAIGRFYDLLKHMFGSPVIAVNAAAARALAGDAAGALKELEALEGDAVLRDYAPYFVARADALERLDRKTEAASWFARAIEAGGAAPELAHLEGRLAACL
ncbi:MAG: sigma-70 family RNA polymerase sigma factor [Parvularculaceae bacterium]